MVPRSPIQGGTAAAGEARQVCSEVLHRQVTEANCASLLGAQNFTQGNCFKYHENGTTQPGWTRP